MCRNTACISRMCRNTACQKCLVIVVVVVANECCKFACLPLFLCGSTVRNGKLAECYLSWVWPSWLLKTFIVGNDFKERSVPVPVRDKSGARLDCAIRAGLPPGLEFPLSLSGHFLAMWLVCCICGTSCLQRTCEAWGNPVPCVQLDYSLRTCSL